jgi:hypothetical protein
VVISDELAKQKILSKAEFKKYLNLKKEAA